MNSGRVVPLALLALVLTAGCASTVAPGIGTFAGAASTAPTGGSEPTETTQPSASTATTEPTDTSESTEPTTTGTGLPSGQPTESSDPEQLVAAEAVGASFEFAVNVGNLDIAYGLLCSADRSEVTLEEFSGDAPAPGGFTLEIADEVSPGVFRAVATFDGDSGDIYLRSEDGSYCVSQDA